MAGNDLVPAAWNYTVAIAPTSSVDDFETGDFSKFPWQRSSSPSGIDLWFISDATADSASVHGGRFGAQAGDLADGQRTTLEVTLETEAGSISFWRKVSSEASFDFLEFYIDGTRRDRWSGELDWASVSYPVSAGVHTFSWQYAKDGSISRGADSAWIDDVVFPKLAADTTRPTVSAIVPVDGATIYNSSTSVNVTFSEAVQRVDASDLVLSGTAAAAATVGAPILQSGNTWRFPVTGLANGTLNLRLAPDANDIEDLAGNDLVPVTWSYTVTIRETSNVEDFETGDFAEFPWRRTSSPSGSGLWFISDATAIPTLAHGGRFGAQAGDLADDQRTTLEVTLETEGGSISFWRKISSEANYDFLEFYIDGERLDRWSGDLDWGSVSYPVSAGVHTFSWQYAKDYSVSSGADTAWIDDLVFPPVVPDTTPPTVSQIVPADGATISTASVSVFVTFSEAVQGVDASDLVLSGTAAGEATVRAPIPQADNTWRFPVTGLTDGTLNLSLAPDANDIQDRAGNDLVAESWSYPVRVTASSTEIQIVANYTDGPDEGFFDPTLGAARRAAFEYALGIWEGLIGPSYAGETIVVEASMDPMGGSSSSAVLGSAWTPTIHRDYDGLVSGTWYGAALANHLVGEDLYYLPEVMASFNSDVDDSEVLGSTDWYYGLDGNPDGDIDFVTVVLHEVGHGLNFFDLMNSDGSFAYGYMGIYERFVELGDGTPLPSLSSNAERAAAIVSDDLWWSGAEGVAGNAGVRPKLYAPTTYRSGSSVSHLDETVHRYELMSPFYSGADHTPSELELGILVDMGWTLIAPNASSLSEFRHDMSVMEDSESTKTDRLFNQPTYLRGETNESGADVEYPVVDTTDIATDANATDLAIDSLMAGFDPLTFFVRDELG